MIVRLIDMTSMAAAMAFSLLPVLTLAASLVGCIRPGQREFPIPSLAVLL